MLTTPGAAVKLCGAVLVAALVATACAAGADDDLATDDEVRARATTSTVAPSTTTTTPLPAGGRQPDADDPLRVLFSGDSIGYELAAAGIAALGGGGEAITFFVANPSLTREAGRNGLWELRLEESDPEVIVMLVGVWERMVFGRERFFGMTVPQYRTQVIDPFIDLITANGAEVVWVTSPIVDEFEAAEQIKFLNGAFQSLGESDDRVTFIDAAELVANPDGSFTDVLTDEDGTMHRVRRVDGTHLCPDGAIRMARPVVDLIADRWNVAVADDWTTGSWRMSVPFEDHATECPPAG